MVDHRVETSDLLKDVVVRSHTHLRLLACIAGLYGRSQAALVRMNVGSVKR